MSYKPFFLLNIALALFCSMLLSCAQTGNLLKVRPTISDKCKNETVSTQEKQVPKKSMRIPGGHYIKPYIINVPNKEYILDGDINADGTAIAIRASNVVLNLNGKTITYNQTKAGEGVTLDAYNKSYVSIVNGRIIQGRAQSEGDVYGGGNNPVKSLGALRVLIAGIYARYGGRDVNGFYLKYVEEGVVEDCTLEDMWNIGTMKNRHQGKNAIGIGARAVVRNNRVINARQGGIGTGDNSEVYGNNISINSMATNSAGIGGYKAKNIKVHHNTIIGRGEHPLGIAFVSAGTDNIEVYNNTIDVQTTRLGDEYAATGGNYAVGFRTTWGGNNISFHDNTIIVRTDSRSNGTQSASGKPVIVNAKGRGMMVSVNAGEKARFYNNTITVLDKDGSGKAYGIACTGNNAGEMIFEGNTVTNNILNIALGDEYGSCGGHPLFVRNTFVKADNYPVYKTVASELGGYFEGTGRFVSNVYKNGASQDSININAGGKAAKSVHFGRELTARLLTHSGTPIAGANLTLVNGGVPFDSIATTDATGKAKLVLYDYELHNRNSKTTQRRTLAPHTIEIVAGSERFATKPDLSSSAWDARAATGEYHLELYKEGMKSSSGKLIVFY